MVPTDHRVIKHCPADLAALHMWSFLMLLTSPLCRAYSQFGVTISPTQAPGTSLDFPGPLGGRHASFPALFLHLSTITPSETLAEPLTILGVW